MNNEQKTIFVYDSFSFEEPVLLGRLFVNVIKGEETYSFEYENDWLKNNKLSVNLDPELLLYGGRQFPSGKKIFGMFADSSPDRWGRILMNKRERIKADLEQRKPSKLYDSDYLLGVFDDTRMGGIRFKTDKNGPFLSDDKETSAPPWTSLRSLEEASRNIEDEKSGYAVKWLNQLLKPGSSLGGARPKATVIDVHGNLWIAKFPSINDEYDAGAWEKVAQDLAQMCGLNVIESKLEKYSKQGSTFLIKRFDREKERRIHFASAMTLLAKTDGASASDGVSYLDIAAFIKSHGASPKDDLKELWMRIVFNMAISNVDDHLRNHAFILKKNGWSLSPLYDVNPVYYGEELSLLVDENDNRISVDLAVKAAPKYGIDEASAKKISEMILKTVGDNWERIAKQCGLSRAQIEHMRPAFNLTKRCN